MFRCQVMSWSVKRTDDDEDVFMFECKPDNSEADEKSCPENDQSMVNNVYLTRIDAVIFPLRVNLLKSLQTNSSHALNF